MRNFKGHKTKLGKMEIPTSYCQEPSCEFFGKRAQQGVCYHRQDATEKKYIESVRKYAAARMNEIKSLRQRSKLKTDKKWIKYLESNLECCWMNEEFTMAELILLRAKVGRLENQLGKRK